MTMKHKKHDLPMSETIRTGTLLALVGGFFDAYTYIARGGVFANAQTGNVVLLAMNLADGNFIKALSYLIPILAFVLGIFTAEFIHNHEQKLPLHWRQIVIVLETATVVIVAFLPTEKGMYSYNMLANVMISYVCSLQVQSFRRIHGITAATTMCTGNLRSGTDLLMRYQKNRNKQDLKDGFKYYMINVIFIIGAVISVFVTRHFGGPAVIFCALPLVLVFILMFFSPRKNFEKEK